MTRNYKCPNCQGEFNDWDMVAILDRKSDIEPSPAVAVCPFCGVERGKYAAAYVPSWVPYTPYYYQPFIPNSPFIVTSTNTLGKQ